MLKMDSTRFHELREAGHLPSPAGVGLQILHLARSEETTAQEISRLIQIDPALTGRILKLANSFYSAPRSPITTLADAVVRLGVRTVCGVAMGFSVVSGFRGGPCKDFDYQGFWSHSLATAVAAEALSRRVDILPLGEAFTCGLLSQVGKLALASIYPEKYAEVLEDCGDCSPLELVETEQQSFVTDHWELGAALLKDWGLPDLFAQAVLYHEHPDEGDLEPDSREKQLALLLSAAIQLANLCVAAEGTRESLVPELFSRGKRIKVDSTMLSSLCDEVVSQWQEWGQILDVKTQALPSLWSSIQTFHESSLRVLVVDDDPTMLQILAKLLTSAGHSVVSANNGREALAVVLETNPQLVITDWMMPKIDGVEFCKAMRGTKMGQWMYIIVLTIREDEEHIVQAFDAGADDYIVKPIHPKMLMARVRAGRRMIGLQEESARDKEEIRRYTTSLALLTRKLERAALTDALTDLPNRRYMIDRLEQEWVAASGTGHPLACMMLDIDDFKQVNDTYGHEVGDQVLEQTAAFLRTSKRKHDVVCRYGGEEFVLICPDTDLGAAKECAERLRTGIETNVITVSGQEFNCQLTISIGVAARETSLCDPDALLKAADRALYCAKEAGRNQVAVYHP